MKNFSGKLAVITGGGTGMGRALARALIAEGCDVAMCDVLEDNMSETLRLCQAEAPQGRKISTHVCDVADPEAVQRFAREVQETHAVGHINLLFNNAGVGGGGSFVTDPLEPWERTFNICWNGVYNCARAFMPLLVASEEGHIINTSSVNGFWASIGPDTPHTAYSAAKFAVKGFTEALVTDLRLNAPHVKCSVVMPGHIGTSIAINSGKIIAGGKDGSASRDINSTRAAMRRRGMDVDNVSDEQLVTMMEEMGKAFRDNAPTTSEQAAEIILNGVREERWRILVGEDAQVLDEQVRGNPEGAYELDFLQKLSESGRWGMLAR